MCRWRSRRPDLSSGDGSRASARRMRRGDRGFSIGSARRCAPATTAGGPRRRTSGGSAGTSGSTAGGHPREMGADEVTRFLTALAVDGKVSASTQNQALAALLFLYGDVLGLRLPWLDDLVRARRPGRLPAVLSRVEVGAVLACLHGTPRLMACLLYGAGLRLLECARHAREGCRLRGQPARGAGGKGRSRPRDAPARDRARRASPTARARQSSRRRSARRSRRATVLRRSRGHQPRGKKGMKAATLWELHPVTHIAFSRGCTQ